MAWDVTFHYQQELRSEFMNTLFKGVFQPGVYNANMALFTKEGQGASADGVYLKLLKGTTLIFSNGFSTYADGPTTRVERDLNATGTYLVKCVANEDLEIQLISLDAPAFLGDETVAGTPDASLFFVFAWFDYDTDAAGLLQPSFDIAVPNTNTTNGFPADAYLLFEDDALTTVNQDLSYLLLGTVIDNGIRTAVDNLYVTGNAWTAHAGDESGATYWIQNHVFTARGLPDYNRQITYNASGFPISILFAPQYSRAYLTSGEFSYGGTLYDIDGQSWKSMYGQRFAATSSAPTSTTGFLSDGAYATNVATSYTMAAPSLVANQMYVDIYFLALRAEQTSPTAVSLDTLFSGGTYLASRKILPYRVAVTRPGGWDALLETTTTLQDEFDLSGIPLVVLDASVVNIERLKSFIANRNFLPPIIDRMRRDEELSPFLTAQTADVLFPIAIAFKSANAGATNYNEAGSRLSLFNGTESAVNPANVLTFLELQASTVSTFGIANLVEDAYSALVFLDDSETT